MSRKSDTEVLNWLLENVNYLEHHADKERPFNFWPHESYDPVLLCDEAKVGMSLREYVESMIVKDNPLGYNNIPTIWHDEVLLSAVKESYERD